MDRVLADAFLSDLARGHAADPVDAAEALGVRVAVVQLPGGLRSLASDGAIYASRAEHVGLGLAQLLLLRARVGHRDGDVAALADMMRRGVQDAKQDFDAIPVDIDSSRN